VRVPTLLDWYLCLFCRSPYTLVAIEYFYQDTWAAGKVFAIRPSTLTRARPRCLSGLLSDSRRWTAADVQRLRVTLPELVPADARLVQGARVPRPPQIESRDFIPAHRVQPLRPPTAAQVRPKEDYAQRRQRRADSSSSRERCSTESSALMASQRR